MSNGTHKHKFIHWPYDPEPTDGQIIKYNEVEDHFAPTDDDSIHDNVSGEVNAIAEKTDIHDNDLVIIEDSENSYSKKKAKVSNLAQNINNSIISITTEDASKDYIESNSTNWLVVQSFPYPGTTVFTPTKFSIIGSRNSNSGTCTCRLYDKTNDQEIASVTFSDDDKAIYTDSSLENLPTNDAIFEIQIKKNSGSKIRFHSCIIH